MNECYFLKKLNYRKILCLPHFPTEFHLAPQSLSYMKSGIQSSSDLFKSYKKRIDRIKGELPELTELAAMYVINS